MPATYYNPDIFFILLRARESLFKNLSGGMFTIFSMQLEDRDSFSTRVKVLKTDVYNLSMGGIKKISLISYASDAGLPSCFSSHILIAFCRGVPLPAIYVYKFQIIITN